METDNFQIFTNVAMTANRHSASIDANQYALVDIQAVWTGTPTGDLYIETSNDVGTVYPDGTIGDVTNWTTYTGSTNSIAGAAGNFAWHIWATGFKWIRLSYLYTSGTGTLNARVNQKG